MSSSSPKIETYFFNVSKKRRWLMIIAVFLAVTLLDFSTPPEYILAYLYTIPILISVSFLKPRIAKTLLVIAVFATLLNLVFPHNVANIPSVLVNRLLAALSIVISSYFMVQYIRYSARTQEQEKLFATEQNIARMREDLMATLTHDLKTPLLGEQKTLQHFLEGALGPVSVEQKETLAALNRNKQRQLELVNNLLSVYQHDNLGVQIRMEAVDLDDLIADVLTEVQSLAADRKINLEYACLRTPPTIKGDALQLKRVIANILHNALNYTPSGGYIGVRLSEQARQLRVDIEDTGPGIAEKDLEHIFRRFYRAEGTRDIVGTGLGLYLSRQLVQAHRGRIWAENIAGGGCRFSFTLPVDEGHVS